MLSARELKVLRAVRDGAVNRDPLYGDLAPWMMGTQQVSWSVTVLVLDGLSRLGAFAFGPPRITPRGMRMLEGCAELRVFGDQ